MLSTGPYDLWVETLQWLPTTLGSTFMTCLDPTVTESDIYTKPSPSHPYLFSCSWTCLERLALQSHGIAWPPLWLAIINYKAKFNSGKFIVFSRTAEGQSRTAQWAQGLSSYFLPVTQSQSQHSCHARKAWQFPEISRLCFHSSFLGQTLGVFLFFDSLLCVLGS